MKKPPGRSRNTLENNIKIYLKSISDRLLTAFTYLKVGTNGGLL
jgi:hypothetical protein